MTYFLVHCLMFLKGALTGFSYNIIGLAAALFITNFALNCGKKQAFIAAIGLSLTNLLWASLSAFAVALVTKHFSTHLHFYTFFGSLILLYFAYNIYFKKEKTRMRYLGSRKDSETAFLEACLFGLASPEKILGYAALFALLNVSQKAGLFYEKIPLVLGVGVGSLIFWSVYIFTLHTPSFSLWQKHQHHFQKGSALFFGGLGSFGLVASLIKWYATM